MTTQKRFIKRQRISHAKFSPIVNYFCDDLTAYETSRLIKVKRHTIERYYTLFRKWIFEETLEEEKTYCPPVLPTWDVE